MTPDAIDDQPRSADHEHLLDLGQRWAAAELGGDTVSLAAMAHPDLRLVGPLGFILTKEGWLDRYDSGDLVITELAWDQVELRVFSDTAIAIGRQRQKAAYRGMAADGDFRTSLVFVRDHDAANGWLISSIHLSQLRQPPTGESARQAGAGQ